MQFCGNYQHLSDDNLVKGSSIWLTRDNPLLFTAVKRVPPVLRFGNSKRLLRLATPELNRLLPSVPKSGFSLPFQP
jgi:hypothetical protein